MYLSQSSDNTVPSCIIQLVPQTLVLPVSQGSETKHRSSQQAHGFLNRAPFSRHDHQHLHFEQQKTNAVGLRSPVASQTWYRWTHSCLQFCVWRLTFRQNLFARFSDLVPLFCGILHTWVGKKPTRPSSRSDFLTYSSKT